MKISLIVAMDEKRGIGKNNKIPWHIPEDSKWFHEKTVGHVVIMGRKTFESIGKPLSNRTNIIITHDTNYIIQNIKDVKIADSLNEAIKLGKEIEHEELFIIGGGQVYEQGIKFADRLYLTIIEEEFEADTFFPDYSAFKKVIFEKPGESGGYKYKFLILEKGNSV